MGDVVDEGVGARVLVDVGSLAVVRVAAVLPPRPLCDLSIGKMMPEIDPIRDTAPLSLSVPHTYLRRWVPHHEQVLQVGQPGQVLHARRQLVEVNEVERQVQLPQELAGARFCE